MARENCEHIFTINIIRKYTPCMKPENLTLLALHFAAVLIFTVYIMIKECAIKIESNQNCAFSVFLWVKTCYNMLLYYLVMQCRKSNSRFIVRFLRLQTV